METPTARDGRAAGDGLGRAFGALRDLLERARKFRDANSFVKLFRRNGSPPPVRS
jgi:hypothetical protein